MTQKFISITELPNELTSDIDLASPLGIVRLLRQTDAQILNGYKTFPAIYDKEILDRLERCVEMTTELVSNPVGSRIILAGAGTSGRLAMFIVRTLNKVFPQPTPLFHYLIAGTNLALIKAQEGAEDDAIRGVEELQQIAAGAQRVLYIGITCGLSAPYIAGQIDWCLGRDNVKSVLLGFNPIERARTNAVEGWNKTFQEVARAAEESPNCVVLNPVIGPEPITGSTRMKGGSATKILLETIFFAALRRAKCADETTGSLVADLKRYDEGREAVYAEAPTLAELVALAGNTIRARSDDRRGHLYYLGEDTPGILGLVDASECPPTFGAAFGDVCGYLGGGWDTLLGPGFDLSDRGEWYRIGFEEFTGRLLPMLNENDLVVGLGIETLGERVSNMLRDAAKKGAKTAAVVINPASPVLPDVQICVTPRVPFLGPVSGAPVYAEYAMKLAINALTTGGHVLAGKVFGNRMIDLRISNNKLFFRTVGIVSALMGVSEEAARESVLKSVYQTDKPSEATLNAPISEHIRAGTHGEKIVPRALLLATGKFTHAEACAALAKEPIVRNIIGEFVGGSQ